MNGKEMETAEFKWNFANNVALAAKVVNSRQIACALACFTLAVFPLLAIDGINLLWVAGLEAAVLGLALWRLKSHRKYIVFFFVSMFVFFFAGEIYLRLSSFGSAGLSFREYSPAGYGNPFANFEYSEETYTGIRPNTKVMFKADMFTVNERGFRGRTYSQEKPEGVYRILVIGASVCVGSGVEEESRFSAIIENKFNESDLSAFTGKPKAVEVINLSIPGADLGNMIHVLKHEGVLYKPDLIMFLANKSVGRQGDIQVRARKAKTYDASRYKLFWDSKYEFFRNRFFFARLLHVAVRGDLKNDRAGMKSQSFLPLWAVKNNVKKTEKAKVDVKKMSEERPQLIAALDMLKEFQKDSKIALYLLKPREKLKDPYDNIEYRRFLQHLAAEYGMYVIDTYEADFSKYTPADLQAYPGEGHPNKYAHRVLADYMYKRLVEIMSGAGAQNTVYSK